MERLIVEIKAKCKNHEVIEDILRKNNADFKGIDHQTDTYFNTKEGRLKLREGNIENHLIFYNRENISGPKESRTILYKPGNSNLKDILEKTNGTWVQVIKKRKIFFIDNVKFHLDDVQNLGQFIEIEAIDTNGKFKKEELLKQCQHYLKLFGINNNDLIADSYSDQLIHSCNIN